MSAPDHGVDRRAQSSPLPPSLAAYLPPDLAAEVMRGDARLGLLLDAHSRLRSVRYLLGTHLPQPLVNAVEREDTPGSACSRRLYGSLLFADISGFTALSERLASEGRQGIERLTDCLNDHFERMVEILIHSGGELLKYAGDALLTYFPASDGGRQARWAVRAGHRMLRALASRPTDGVLLRMKVGIATGPFYATCVGTAHRMEYVIHGDAVVRTLDAENAADAGQVLVDIQTAERLPISRHRSGSTPEFRVADDGGEDLDGFEIRAGGRRRARSTVSWMSGREEILEQLVDTLRQVEVLASYMPTVLARRIIATMDARSLPGENRPVAVLFVYASGFDPPPDAGGAPEGAPTRLLSGYFRAVQRIVSHYAGVVSRVDPYGGGSKFLILFGAPVAHEDDPRRAVRAALEIDAALKDLSVRWQRLDPPPRVHHHLGLAWGPTFAGQVGTATHREYTVMGDDVNLAARLMASAKSGQILVSGAVRDAVGDHARFRALSPMRIRGKEAPVPVWQVEAMRDARWVRRLRSRRPLVGRASEWSQVRVVLRDWMAGEGTRLVIRGEAGIGKSHLVDALAQRALERGARLSFTACPAYSKDTPYAAWSAVLAEVAGIESRDSPVARGERLEAWLETLGQSASAPLFSGLLGLPRRDDALSQVGAAAPARAHHTGSPDLFARLGRAVDGATGSGANLWDLARRRRAPARAGSWQQLRARVADRQRERLVEALTALLEALTSRKPLALVFEDAQWMDGPSRALLDAVADRLSHSPLLLIEVERSLDDEGPNVLFLDPLDADATAELIEQVLHDRVVPYSPSQLARAIIPLTGGNPLFIEEMVRWLCRTGWSNIDRLDDGLWDSGMLQELIISRLDALSYEVGEVARAAAVLDAVVTAEDLTPLLEISPGIRDEALESLEEAGWLVPAGTDDARGYRFRQPLVREVIYGSLPRARRRRFHARYAAHLTAREKGRGAHPEVLAHHYARAGDHAAAAVHRLAAGIAAEERGVFEQARAYYASAFDEARAAEPSTTTCEIQGDAALLMGDLSSAEAAYASAAEEGRAWERLMTKRVVVIYARAETYYREAEVEAARDCLRRARALAQEGSVPLDVLAGVRRAAAAIEEEEAGRWPNPEWHRCGDHFTVTLRTPAS